MGLPPRCPGRSLHSLGRCFAGDAALSGMIRDWHKRLVLCISVQPVFSGSWCFPVCHPVTCSAALCLTSTSFCSFIAVAIFLLIVVTCAKYDVVRLKFHKTCLCSCCCGTSFGLHLCKMSHGSYTVVLLVLVNLSLLYDFMAGQHFWMSEVWIQVFCSICF